MALTFGPDDYYDDDGNVNGPRPATAATGAVAVPGYVNGGTSYSRRQPWHSASIFIVSGRRSR